MKKEIWKEIPEYKGIYEASNKGRIRTCKNKETITEHHGKRIWKQRVLSQTGKHSIGGFRVMLYKNGKPKKLLVHRLVASAFLELDLFSKMTVDHIDGNRENNNLENLRVVTLAENIRNAFYEQNLYGTVKKIKLTKIETGEVTIIKSMTKCDEFLGYKTGLTSGLLKKNSFFERKGYKIELFND